MFQRLLAVVGSFLLAVSVVAQVAPPRLGAAAGAPEPPALADGFFLEPATPDGLGVAVDIEVASDGRFFALEKNTGAIRAFSPAGELLAWEWVVLWPEVFANGDRGALGFTLHPDFPAVPHVYILYTVDDGPVPRPETGFRAYGRLVRYSVDPDDPNRIDPASRRVLLGETYHDGVPSCFNSHSIGTVAFGHDGSLFVGAGDAGSWAVDIDTGGLYPECFSPDPEAGVHPSEDVGSFRSQRVESLAGKVLRIDPETGEGYASNPFYTGDPTDAASKVWALGLRNPFRFSLAPPEAGDTGPGTLLIGDVGNAVWEELNVARGGENFGWPCREGPAPFAPAEGVTAPFDCEGAWAGEPTDPVAYWHHTDPARSSPAGEIGRSVTGGVVYEGTAYPEAYQGAYFFADFTAGWVRSARLGADGLEGVSTVADGAGPLVDLVNEPMTGSLLAVNVGTEYGNGSVVRLRYVGGGGSPPIARLRAPERTGEAPVTLAFDAARSFDPDGGDLSYTWAFGDGATADGPEAVHTYGRVGVYPVTLTVRDPDGLESRASVTVRVGETMPEVEIVAPTAFTIPEDGRLALRATATDPLEPPDGLRAEWTVDLVHNDHEHQRFFYAEGLGAEFYLQPHAGEGETAHYRATVTVTDSEGLVRRVSRTFREDVAADVDVAPAGAYVQSAGGVDVTFPEALPVGRVGIPGLREVPEGLRVEARLGGEWSEVPFPSALAEADAVQVIFAEIDAEAVRVRGVDTLAVYARLGDVDGLPGGGEAVDAGAPVALGRASRADDRLVVVGGGAAETGSAHLVQSAFRGDGGTVVRVDALAARDEGGAGVTLRASLDARSPRVSLLAMQSGEVVLWTHDVIGGTQREVVGTWEAPVWLRLVRRGARVEAALSSDGEAWDVVGTRLPALPEAVVGGPAVVGGDVEGRGLVAVAWFGEVARLRSGPDSGRPDPEAFEIEGVYPNPAARVARVVLDAGRTGTYRIDLVDLVGRVVAREPLVSVDDPRQIPLRLNLGSVGAGTYLVRVTHVESASVRSTALTVVR